MNQPTIVSDQTGMAQPDTGMFSGFGVIFRKEIREWNATRRTVFAAATATLLAAAGPVGYWIYKGGLHAGRIALSGTNYEVIVALPSVILSTLGLFMVIAMTMGIIVREQDLGTLQWVFTKPLSRVGLVLAKWLANSAMTILAIVVIPTIISFGIIDAMFGLHDRGDPILGMVGVAVLFVFQCALSCGISGIFNSTTAVAGISFALFFLPILVAPYFNDWVRLIPTQISTVASNIAAGESLENWDYATIASTVLITVVLIVFAARKLSTREYR